MPLPIFVDIDGTLTDTPTAQWGKVHTARLHRLQDIIASGREVVLWSGGGSDYVKEFARAYGLAPAACIGKPDTVVDDNPTIRPEGRIKIVAPEAFFSA